MRIPFLPFSGNTTTGELCNLAHRRLLCDREVNYAFLSRCCWPTVLALTCRGSDRRARWFTLSQHPESKANRSKSVACGCDIAVQTLPYYLSDHKFLWNSESRSVSSHCLPGESHSLKPWQMALSSLIAALSLPFRISLVWLSKATNASGIWEHLTPTQHFWEAEGRA